MGLTLLSEGLAGFRQYESLDSLLPISRWITAKGGLNTIHWINNYLVNGVVCFVNSYPLDGDLSDG